MKFGWPFPLAFGEYLRLVNTRISPDTTRHGRNSTDTDGSRVILVYDLLRLIERVLPGHGGGFRCTFV